MTALILTLTLTLTMPLHDGGVVKPDVAKPSAPSPALSSTLSLTLASCVSEQAALWQKRSSQTVSGFNTVRNYRAAAIVIGHCDDTITRLFQMTPINPSSALMQAKQPKQPKPAALCTLAPLNTAGHQASTSDNR
jgi:hypothetical protein